MSATSVDGNGVVMATARTLITGCLLVLLVGVVDTVEVGQSGSNSLKFDVTSVSAEKILIKELLNYYEEVGVVGRPVQNQSETIEVRYGLSLIQILDLNEKDQVLTTNVWSRYSWTDILLKWNPDNFGGVQEVRIPSSNIWTPDIVLYNYADIRLKEHREAMTIVSCNGSVTWIPPAIFKSTCYIDITNFPYDVQKCKMKFGSWTYDGFKLDIQFIEHQSVDTGDYVESNEWKLIGSNAYRNVEHYSGLTAPYIDLTFHIHLQRIAIFHKYILVLPCVLLSFLTLVIFWLPPESPAKVMLGMSVFVAFFVLLLLLADSTPPAAQSIPLIGAYFCMNMILITLSTFLSVIIIQTHIRGDRKNKVPPWLKRIAIDGMARVLCMSELIDKEPPTKTPPSSSAPTTSRPTSGPTPVITGGSGLVHYSSSAADAPSSSTLLKSHMQYAASKDPAALQQYQRRTAAGSSVLSSSNVELSYGGRGTASAATQPSSAVVPVGGRGMDNAGVDRSPVHCSAPSNVGGITAAGSTVVENDVREIRRMLKAYIGRLENKDVAAKTTKEWRIVARVLDRLFFFCYIGTIMVSLFTVFPHETDEGHYTETAAMANEPLTTAFPDYSV